MEQNQVAKKPSVETLGQVIPHDISDKVYHSKFIMSIFIIIIHSFNLPSYGYTPKDGLYFFEMFLSQNVARVAVPMFFFLSGLFFFLNVRTQKDIFNKIGKRCTSVVVPYLLWNGLHTLLFLVVLQLPFMKTLMQNAHALTFKNVFNGLFLYKYSYHYWYMLHLIVFFLLSPVLMFLLNNKKTAVATLSILLGVNVIRLTFKEAQIFNLFYYYAGAFFAKWYPDLIFRKKYAKKTVMAAMILFILINVITTVVNSKWILQIAILPMMLCFWVFTDLFSSLKVYPFEKESFFVFSIHIVLLAVIERVMNRLGTSRLCGWIDYLVTPCLCVLGAYVAYRIMKKLLPSIYGLLTGRWINKRKI